MSHDGPLEGALRAHADLTHSVLRVGAEQRPVLVVDNFLASTQPLIDYAAEHCAFAPEPHNLYPGLRAPIPSIYSFAVRAFLGPLIAETFQCGARSVARERCVFSLATTTPDQLSTLQRLPHFDNTDPMHLAVLHYLAGPELGGTSFYRHRATGHETMSAERLPLYSETLRREAERDLPAQKYMDGDTALFERTASIEAVHNRIIVYHTCALHCADIPNDRALSPNPRAGRLTANLFYYFR